jgi:Domain of unknown function (DUF4395)
VKNTWMSPKSLLCPISPLRVGETTARVTGGLAAALIGVYVLTGAGAIPLALAIDYGLRASIRWQHSPLSWLAAHLVRGLRLPDRPIDRAPKLFAARIGMLLLLASSILALVHPPSGLVIGLVLMGFALLEFVLNICVGCLIYRYVMLPLFTQREDA